MAAPIPPGPLSWPRKGSEGPSPRMRYAAAIAQLEGRSLLASSPLVVVNGGISRRDLAKKSAKVGAAVASIPLITSIVRPDRGDGPIVHLATGCQGCGQE